MKKQISMALAAVLFALSLTSCTGPGKATSPFDDTDTDDESVTTTEGDSFFYQGNPDYDYKNVDEHRRLDNYVLDTVDEPWGETHDLHWVNGPIKNYFIYYTFNDYDEINNVNLNNISTISRPRVRVFPADKDGYVMYEVTYTQSFPIRSMEKGPVSSSMYSFYGVRYIDYYTGTMLPYMNVFDKDRSGFVMGEGAGILLLEEYEHAVKRGAKIYAEVVGYANTSDAYHITAPDPEGDGAVRAIKSVVKEAGITDGDEIYVNAHGTGTHLNDAMETKALKKVFGDKAYDLHVSSTKSMTGHMMGATGAVEAIASVLALSNGVVPPTINYKERDEECDLDYTPNKAVKADIKYAISNSLGFGGHNAVIALKKI